MSSIRQLFDRFFQKHRWRVREPGVLVGCEVLICDYCYKESYIGAYDLIPPNFGTKKKYVRRDSKCNFEKEIYEKRIV